jgi:hypothetical protein
MTNGVADILFLQPFPIRVFNMSSSDRVLHKGMVLGHALLHPQGMFATPDFAEKPTSGRILVEDTGDAWRSELDLLHLQAREQDMAYDLLAPHHRMWDCHLGEVNATSHRIELVPRARPVHAQPYRSGTRAREAASAEVQRLLKAGEICPVTSAWVSPVALVPKPDGSLRFCVDYRKLNNLAIRDSYPLLRMYECIESLGDAKIFSTLDCNSGYWEIPVAPEDVEKTTFVC